jgi:hypothetical protein
MKTPPDMNPSTNDIDRIVSEIVELSLCRHTGDAVRDIYTVLMDMTFKITALMKIIREQENG